MLRRIRCWAVLNPLARLSLAALAGILLVEHDVPAAMAERMMPDGAAIFEMMQTLLLLVLAVAVCAAAFAAPRWVPLEAPAMLVFAFVHDVRLGETIGHRLRAELGSLPMRSAHAVVTGSVTPLADDSWDGSGAKSLVEIRASRIVLPQKGRSLAGPAILRGWIRGGPPPPGEHELSGAVSLPRGPANPGQFDNSRHSLRLGFVADLDVRTAKLLRADALPVRAAFLSAAERCREWIGAQMEAGIEGEDEAVSIIKAMALGSTDEAAAELEEPFRQSGTLHVFAVSGLHVALISFIGWTVLRLFGMRRPVAVLLLIAGVFAYAFITGWRPSAARSAIMIAIVMAASLFGRRSQLQNCLGAAALLMLAIDPQQLFLPGFQLSFGVLWSIALFAALPMRWMGKWTHLDPFLPPHLADWRQRTWSQAKIWLWSSVCISVAAWAGSLPLILWHFSMSTPVAILANCVLVPLSCLLLATACASMIFAAAKFTFAQVLANHSNWLFAKLLAGSASFFAGLPGAHSSWNPRKEPAASPIELNVLHLPFGQAASHFRAGSQHWLLDTGTRKNYARIVQPYLRWQEADTAAGIILTHNDIEHTGGAARAFREMRAGWGFLPAGDPRPSDSSLTGLKQLAAVNCRERLFTPRPLAAGDRIDLGSNAVATVLYPAPHDRHDTADDRCLVLRLELDEFRILWCSDIGFIAEKKLLERFSKRALDCEVLIRNNHASDFSGTAEFLLAVRPRIIVSSNVPFIASERLPDTIRDYGKRRRAAVFDQSETGAVSIQITSGSLAATGFLGEKTVTIKPRKRPESEAQPRG